MSMTYPGLGTIDDAVLADFSEITTGGDGMFQKGFNGVKTILTPKDRKVDFIIFEDRTLCYVKSSMGYPAIYPLLDGVYDGKAEAVLMDLDGTSVHSEAFWVWIIERTMQRLMEKPSFAISEEDLPFVSGHSVSEHLEYCIGKYCPGKTVEEARGHYYDITSYEMKEILEGRGREGAFTPAPGLKDFLYTLKDAGVKIGLVTSGLYEKAMPEIISAFQTLKMGDPIDFYDAIITAGTALRKGQTGTIGELAPKPHPWLYAETARVGLGIDPKNRGRVLGFEDSSAGVVSIRLAGFAAVGIGGGNIEQSGVRPLLLKSFDNLCDALPLILGK